VSRWSAERVRIGLAPARVDLARLRWGLGREPSRQASVAVTPKSGEPPWQAALDAAEPALAQFASRGDAVAVVLSNHWVRYQVLPWQSAVTSAGEVEQLARLRFEQTFGAAAASWTIRACERGYGLAQVACAVDTALIDELRTRLTAHGLRLASLQPLLMAAYNDLRRELKGSAAFAIVEAGRLCLSLLSAERWTDIASRRTGHDAAEAIEQELATLGTQPGPPRIDVAVVGEDATWSAGGGRPVRLLGRPDAPGRRSLALWGTA